MSVLPRGRLRPSRPVALRVAPLLGGRRHRPAPADRLARPVSRHDRLAGQPLAGALAPAARSRRRSRRRASPSATIDSPGQYNFWTPGVWGSVQDRMLDAIGGLGAVRSHDAALRRPRTRHASPTGSGGSCPVRREEARRRSRIRNPTTRSRRSSRGSPRYRRRLPLHCVSLEASGVRRARRPDDRARARLDTTASR